MKKVLCLLTAAIAISTAMTSLAAASEPTGGGSPVDCLIPGSDDRCERWAHRYTEGEGDAPFGKHNQHRAEMGAISPTGDRAFIVGSVVDGSRICPGNPPTLCMDMQTVAYDAVTGNILWVKQQSPPWENAHSLPRTVVVSADGSTVFTVSTVFVGSGSARDTLRDLHIVAYDAATGARRWVRTYDGPARMQEDAFAAAVSPIDDRLFVAAASTSTTLPVSTYGYSPLHMTRGTTAAGLEVDVDFALLSFEGASGELMDERRYGGATFRVDGETRASWDVPVDIEVSPDGQRIVVSGLSDGRQAYATGSPHSTAVAWDASDEEPGTGWDLAWVREVAGIPLGLGVFPRQAMAVFAGAYGDGGTESNPYAVLGLDLHTGEPRWEKRYALGGLGGQLEHPRGLLADAERGMVALPGISRYPTSSTGTMGVLALRASDGGTAWTKRLRDPMSNATIIFNYDVDGMPLGAIDARSGHVQVTSTRGGHLATFSLDGATGAQRWAALFEKPLRSGSYFEESGGDWPVAMGAAGGTVVVFGNSYIPRRQTCSFGPAFTFCPRDDFLTVAYEV